MDAEFQFDLTDELLSKAAWKAVLYRRLALWLTLCGVLIVAILVDLAYTDSPCVFVVYSLVLAYAVMARLLRYFLVRRASLKYWREADHRQVVCRVTEEPFEIRTAHFNADTPWRLVEGLRQFNDVWLLHIKGRGYTPVPAEVLDDEARAFIERKVREHGGKVQ